MKYIFLGMPTYISDRILSIMAEAVGGSPVYQVLGDNDPSVTSIMSLKKRIRDEAFNVYHLTTFQGNYIPSLLKIPPNDFEFVICRIEYTLHDFILFKTIEMISKSTISVQSVNSFILNNDQTIKSWKEQHDINNRAGEFDLSSVIRIDASKFMADPTAMVFTYKGKPCDISKSQIEHAIRANSLLNPSYIPKYDIDEHYFKPLSDVMLSDATLEHILKL